MSHTTRLRRPLHALLTYPYTWAVLTMIPATHLLFAWWFQPSALMQGCTLTLDAAGLILWGLFALRSDAFRQHYHRQPDALTESQMRQRLAACPASFAQPVRQCLELVAHMGAEFPTLASHHELEAVQQNLARVVHAYHTLHVRAQRFGTPEQRAAMTALLRTQEASMAATLHSLQTLGGHLTLLSAHTAPESTALRALHDLNQGLQAVLQELHDAST